jgi:hypothetical protein
MGQPGKFDVVIDRVDCDHCRRRVMEVLHKIGAWDEETCETITKVAPKTIMRNTTRKEGEKAIGWLVDAGATAYLWKDGHRV